MDKCRVAPEVNLSQYPLQGRHEMQDHSRMSNADDCPACTLGQVKCHSAAPATSSTLEMSMQQGEQSVFK